MKVAITGTTGGLGSSLKYEFSRNPANEIIELNRPDFNLEDDFTSLPNDWDIFINNAYSEKFGFRQTELLYYLFEANKHRKCHIINIGSVSGDGDRQAVYQYAINKAALEKASTQLSLVESECKVSLIKPGRMKTKMTDHRDDYYRMQPGIVASTAVWMAHQLPEINIKSITVDVQNSNRKIK